MTTVRIFAPRSAAVQLVQSQIDDTNAIHPLFTTHYELTDDIVSKLVTESLVMRDVLSSGHHSMTVIAITLCRQHTRTYLDEMLTCFRGYRWGNSEQRWPGYYMVNIEKHNGQPTAVTSYRYGTPSLDLIEYHHMISREYTVSEPSARELNAFMRAYKNNAEPC